MKKGLTALFTSSDIDRDLANFESEVVSKTISVLSYTGEKFVNMARSTQTYKDQTGNLRSSIGYVIAIDGEIKKEEITGKPEGVSHAKDIANQVVNANPNGIILIGFAGMQYAAAVESKGYDVISNSVPAAAKLLSDLKRGLGL